MPRRASSTSGCWPTPRRPTACRCCSSRCASSTNGEWKIAGKILLTHAVYDELGGLAGAIAAEAERAVSSLPPKTLALLPRLLRLLAEPARDGKALTLREVPQPKLATDASEVETAEAALLAALLQARILIARTDADGHPTVRLAHDAVLASLAAGA